jgi:hypothetical protein
MSLCLYLLDQFSQPFDICGTGILNTEVKSSAALDEEDELSGDSRPNARRISNRKSLGIPLHVTHPGSTLFLQPSMLGIMPLPRYARVRDQADRLPASNGSHQMCCTWRAFAARHGRSGVALGVVNCLECFLTSEKVSKPTHGFAAFEKANTRTASENRTPEQGNAISELLLSLPAVVYSPSKMTYVPYSIYG